MSSPLGTDGLWPPETSGQNAMNSDTGTLSAPAPAAFGGFTAAVAVGTGGGVGNGKAGIPPTGPGVSGACGGNIAASLG